jgi:hypothetical protein
MKTEQLHDLWTSPDNSRLTSKQFSFRLPVHIAAKIAALCEIYPQKNRTQIVADLLTSSLDELEKNLPEALGDQIEASWQKDISEQAAIEGQPQPGDLYYMGGARGRFRSIANNHYRDLEKELGNENPEPLYPNFLVTQSDLTKSK